MFYYQSTNNSENSVSAGGAQLRGGAFAAPPPSSSSSFSNAVHSVPPEASLVPTESSGRISPYSSGRYQLQQRLGHPSPPSPSPSSPQTLSHTGSYSSSTHNHHPSRTDSFNSYGHTPYIPQASLPIHSYPLQQPSPTSHLRPHPPFTPRVPTPTTAAPHVVPSPLCLPYRRQTFPTAPPSTHASESSPKDTHIHVPPSPPHQEGQVVKEKTTKRKARVEVEVEGEHDDDKNVDLKRMRNTEAARRSRAKKMAKMDMLEIAVEKLEVDNSRLVVKLAILESDKATWRTKQEEYIARIAQLEMQLSESHQAIIGKNE
ncbi:hypothetical protein BC829DRAFT_445928 [Chytridium lagenaria]|nr:hypothetical protein BC829DRAFT_445928 [Chytridium lagenaria]